jgi:hypothetical protein
MRNRLTAAAVAAGAVVVLFGLARRIGAERFARAIRSFDQSSGLFTTWGTGVYGCLAPRLLRPFYQRVASDALPRHKMPIRSADASEVVFNTLLGPPRQIGVRGPVADHSSASFGLDCLQYS